MSDYISVERTLDGLRALLTNLDSGGDKFDSFDRLWNRCKHAVVCLEDEFNDLRLYDSKMVGIGNCMNEVFSVIIAWRCKSSPYYNDGAAEPDFMLAVLRDDAVSAYNVPYTSMETPTYTRDGPLDHIKYVILQQSPVSYTFEPAKDLLIKRFTGYQDGVFTYNPRTQSWVKRDDPAMVRYGILDGSRLIYNGKLSLLNEIIRMRDYKTDNTLYGLTQAAKDVNSKVYGKYAGYERLRNKHNVIITEMVHNTTPPVDDWGSYAEYVMINYLKQGITQDTLGASSLNDDNFLTLGGDRNIITDYSICYIPGSCIPCMFAFNYLRAMAHKGYYCALALHRNGKLLELLSSVDNINLRNELVKYGKHVVNSRESSRRSALKRKRQRRNHGVDDEDIDL